MGVGSQPVYCGGIRVDWKGGGVTVITLIGTNPSQQIPILAPLASSTRILLLAGRIRNNCIIILAVAV